MSAPNRVAQQRFESGGQAAWVPPIVSGPFDTEGQTPVAALNRLARPPLPPVGHAAWVPLIRSDPFDQDAGLPVGPTEPAVLSESWTPGVCLGAATTAPWP